MTDRGIGDNGGPSLEKLTAARKLDRIKEILDMDLSSAQKCIGVGIVVHADTDGVAAEMTTERLKTIGAVKDRETVYRATERLEKEKVAEKIKIEGRPNNYRVMPAHVMDAIVEAYNNKTTRPAQPDGVVGSNPTGNGDVSGRARPDGVVSTNPTGAAQPDGISRAYAPARLESPSGINNNKKQNTNTTTVEENLDELCVVSSDLDELNGHEEGMIAFFRKYGPNIYSDEEARNAIRSDIRHYGRDNAIYAFDVTKERMDSAGVASPWSYMRGVLTKAADAQASKGSATRMPKPTAAAANEARMSKAMAALERASTQKGGRK